MKRFPLILMLTVLTLAGTGTLTFGQDVKALVEQGVEQCNDGKFDQAVATFSQAVKQKSNDASLYYLRGKAYTAKNQYGQALADFDQAIKLNPAYGQAYFGRGMVYVYQENFDKALEEIQKAKDHGFKDEDFLKYVRKLSEGRRKK